MTVVDEDSDEVPSALVTSVLSSTVYEPSESSADVDVTLLTELPSELVVSDVVVVEPSRLVVVVDVVLAVEPSS